MENILLTLLSKMIKQRFISPLLLAELSAAPGARGSTKRLQARAIGAPGQMVQLLLQGILLTGIQGETVCILKYSILTVRTKLSDG